uniref:Uncharacterized protein n=1 Tax=Arion vulgaris TaxID=1028688 RepID=A0A0B7AJ17_9EUPU
MVISDINAAATMDYHQIYECNSSLCLDMTACKTDGRSRYKTKQTIWLAPPIYILTHLTNLNVLHS